MKRSKKASKNEEASQNTTYFFLPLSLFFLLLIGTVISLVQLQQHQSSQSNASVATAMPTLSIQNCTVTSAQMTMTPAEQSFFDQINNYRQQHGISPLVWSTTLQRAAAWMSNDMLLHNSLSHTDSLGRDTLVRLEDCGYTGSANVGENIDNGSSDPAIMFSSWQHAAAQNANLLSQEFTQAAIALATGSGGSYWTLDLGAASPTTEPTNTPAPTFRLTSTPTTPLTATPLPTQLPTFVITPSPTLIAISQTIGTPLPTKPFTPTNTPTPTIAPTPTIDPDFVANPDDIQVFVAAKFPGIGKNENANPKHFTRHIQVNIFDLKNQPVVSGNGFLKFDGNLFTGIIHLGKIQNSTYYAKVVGDTTLQALIKPQFQAFTTNHLNVLPDVSLVQGDLNHDNVLDINDFNLALACFQHNASCTDPRVVDFNDDGSVNILDYNLFLQGYLTYSGD